MLTVFTPTYNRSKTLERVYNSLINQTSKDFEWIIIDDGSTDNTKDVIKRFDCSELNIRYYYQENQGKHMANNLALEKAKGDLFTCLDSDDWFYEDSVEYINNYFQVNSDTSVLMGLDTYSNGEVIGQKFHNLEKINWIKMRYIDKNKSDKCYIFKTDIIRNIKFPQYGKSKHMPPSYQLIKLSAISDFDVTNKKLKFVEYRNDGLSTNIKKQLFTSAENYCEYRKLIHTYLPSSKEKIKNIILYNLSWIHTHFNRKYIWENIQNRLISYILMPISFILYLYYKGGE